MFNSFSLEKTYQFLLIILAFLMPSTVFGGNLIIFFIVILWLISENYKDKFYSIVKSKSIASLNYVFGNNV